MCNRIRHDSALERSSRLRKLDKEEGRTEVHPEDVDVCSDAAVGQVRHVEEELKLVKEELDAKCAEVCQLKVELS